MGPEILEDVEDDVAYLLRGLGKRLEQLVDDRWVADLTQGPQGGDPDADVGVGQPPELSEPEPLEPESSPESSPESPLPEPEPPLPDETTSIVDVRGVYFSALSMRFAST